MGDAVLSRYGLTAGPWATRLRWFAGATTVALNGWESIAAGDPAGIVLHVMPPTLLFVLAEAASPYRVKFAETVRLAAEQAAEDTLVSTLAPAVVDTDPEPVPDTVAEEETAPAVSTMTPQVAGLAPTWESETRTAVDWVFNGGDGPMPTRTVDATNTPLPTEADTATGRLDAPAARAAIEAAWEAGLTIREAATRATRSASYVGGVYAQLAKARGAQPSKGQMRIEGEAA
jgi:hypothetical protein